MAPALQLETYMPLMATIRVATREDLPELQRLRLTPLADPTPPAGAIGAGRRYVLAVDAPCGGLAAALIVSLEPPRAHLDALAIDACCGSPALEARLIAVAEALAQAFGCKAFDVQRRAAA